MANSRVTLLDATREYVSIMHSACHLGKNMSHEYENKFGKGVGFDGQKIGPTLNIRMPMLATGREAWAMSQQSVTETYKTLTVDQVRGEDINFDDPELATTIDDWVKRYVEPGAKRNASRIEKYLAEQMMYAVSNSYADVSGSYAAPTTPAKYVKAKALLKKMLVPDGDPLACVINPDGEAAIAEGISTFYNPTQTISDTFKNGELTHAGGMDFFTSQVLGSITTGTRVGTILTNDAGAVYTTNGTTSIPIDGFTNASDTVKKGEVFTIADVYRVNPETKQRYSDLMQFVVTADATATTNAMAAGVFNFSPAIYYEGVNQNVNARPVDGKAITFIGAASTTYQQAFIFHKEAFSMACVPLLEPPNMQVAQAESDGFISRYIRGYDIINARLLQRMDTFFGWTSVRPEWACRVWHV